MKKHIFFLITTLSAFAMSAQTESVYEATLDDRTEYFYCDFSNGIPDNFTTYDLDEKTLHFSMVQSGLKNGESWIALREEFSSPVNYYAGSGSKHKYADGEEPTAAADWMVTPQIWVKGDDAKLTWYGRSIGDNKTTSSYCVYISTTGNSPEDFINAPIASVENESIIWTKHEISLSQYKGQRIYIAFLNNSFDKEIIGIDNIKVEGEKGLCELIVTTDKYISETNTLSVTANITAYSDEVINSFTAYYEYNGSIFSKEITGISLKKYDSIDFSFDQTIPVSVGDTLRYKVWAEVNNTTLTPIDCTTISFLFIPKRKVVIEEGTAMWCVYCPKGIVAMEELSRKYPDSYIGISLHYDDPLEVFDYRSDMGFPSYPSAYVNRKYLSDDIMKLIETDDESYYTTLNGGLESLFLEALAEQTLAEIDIDAETVNNEIHSTVKTRFAVDVDNADYQVAIVIIENNITDPTYYQDNGFSGSEIPMGGYESLPDRIYNPVYHEVARDIYDTYMGVPGSIPTEITAGKNNIFEFTAAIPDSVKSIENVKVIALLIDQKTGEIMNAAISDAPMAGIDNVMDDNASLSYSIEGEICTIDYSSISESPAKISLYSSSGALISDVTIPVIGGKASHKFEAISAHGIHFVSVTQDNKTSSIKIIF